MADLNELLGQLEQGAALRQQQAALARLYGIDPRAMPQDTGAPGQVALSERGASSADALDPLRQRENQTDDGSMTLGEEIGTALYLGGQGLSFGLVGDEAAARFDSMLGLGDYEERRAHYNRQEERFKSEHPWLAMGAELGGSLVVPSGAVGHVGGGLLNLGGRVLRGGLVGGAGGAVYGAMEGDEREHGSRFQGAVEDAAAGATFGAAIPFAGAMLDPVVQRTNQYLTNRAFRQNAPEIPAIRADAQAAYARGDTTGRTLDPMDTTMLAADIENGLRGQTAVLPTGDLLSGFGRLRDVVDTMDAYAGREMTPREMRNVSDTLQAAVNSENSREAAVATIIRDSIFRPTMYGAAPDYEAADRLWRTLRQSELIEQTMELADNQAGRHTANYELALRSQFGNLERRIIRGTVEATPDEVALIRRIAQGGPVENRARDIGRWAPTGPVAAVTGGGAGAAIGTALGGLLGPGPGAAAGVLGGLLASGAGAVGRAVATKLQTDNANTLSAVVRSGGQLPPTASGIPTGLLEAMEEYAQRLARDEARHREPLRIEVTRP